MKDKFQTRMQEVIDYLDTNASKFSDAIDVPRATVWAYLNDSRQPGVVFLTKLKKRYPQINLNWLISGKGEMIGDESKEVEEIRAKYLAAIEENNRLLKESIKNKK